MAPRWLGPWARRLERHRCAGMALLVYTYVVLVWYRAAVLKPAAAKAFDAGASQYWSQYWLQRAPVDHGTVTPPTVSADHGLGMSCAVVDPATGALGGRVPQRPLPPPSAYGGVRVAYVVPFVAKDLPRLKRVVQHWAVVKPCLKAPSSETSNSGVTVVWAYDGDIASPEGARVRATLESYVALSGPRTRECFAGFEYASTLLDDSFEHAEGAAIMFYGLFKLLEQRHHAFFLAESDVYAVQPDWAPALVREAGRLDCQRHWELGSSPLHHPSFGNLIERGDAHINGNALYVLGCHAFEEYLCRVQTFYHGGNCDECPLIGGCGTGRAFEAGYDHALWRYRREPAEYMYTRHTHRHFALTGFVQNRGEEAYDPRAVVAASPETYFVHSKAAHFNAPQLALLRTYVDTFGVYPNARDNELVYAALKSGELTEATLVRHLCVHGDDTLAAKWFAKQPPCAPFRDRLGGPPVPLPWAERFAPDTAYLWSVDFHGAPVACNVPVLREAGIVVHAEVDYVNCRYFGLCKKRLKVLTGQDAAGENDYRGFSLESDGYTPEGLIAKFYDTYKNDEEFARVDAFMCSHPAANCELFLGFGKPIVVYATTRLEFGRHDAGIDWRLPHLKADAPKRWRSWVKTVVKLANDPRNTVAANNHYDVAYIKYHTGVDAVYLPSWCGDNDGSYIRPKGGWWAHCVTPDYLPVRDEVVIVPYRSNLDRGRAAGSERSRDQHPIVVGLRHAEVRRGPGAYPIKFIDELYDSAEPSRLAFHPALVLVPYQVSTMSLFEFYRMNVPLFAPSLALLRAWHKDHDQMWEMHYGWPQRQADLAGSTDMPDPASDAREAFDFWVGKSDFYTMPHITTFDSWDDLLVKLEAADLDGISQQMKAENGRVRGELVERWAEVKGRFRR